MSAGDPCVLSPPTCAAGPAVPVLRAHGATACTDVTGFGLLGHLAEVARASQVLVEVDASAAPLLDGARECAAAGHLSSLHPENARVAAALQGGMGSLDPATFALLVDPQTGAPGGPVGLVGMHSPLCCRQSAAGSCFSSTCPLYAPRNAAGGLLASVPAEAAEQCVEELRRTGFPHAAVVARVAGPLPENGEGGGKCLRLSP